MSEQVVIFGATSAMAIEAARNFARAGAALFLVARNSEKLDAVSRDLGLLGAKSVQTVVSDLSEIGGHARLFSEIGRLMPGYDHVLVAYGTLGDQKRCEQDFTEADREIRVNFTSVVSLLTVIANHFEVQRRGTIAVITSVAGDRGRQSNYVYGTAKGALGIFLQGLRNRLAPAGVQVVTIKPGFVDTPMTAELKKGALWASPEGVGRGIYRAMKRGRDVVYLPWFWCCIMLVIRHIPERIFKRLKL